MRAGTANMWIPSTAGGSKRPRYLLHTHYIQNAQLHSKIRRGSATIIPGSAPRRTDAGPTPVESSGPPT
jgi:hypothetical protein